MFAALFCFMVLPFAEQATFLMYENADLLEMHETEQL